MQTSTAGTSVARTGRLGRFFEIGVVHSIVRGSAAMSRPRSSFLCLFVAWLLATVPVNAEHVIESPREIPVVCSVDVVVVGRTRILTPEGSSWDQWFDGDTVTEDFMAQREQPAEQTRDGL